MDFHARPEWEGFCWPTYRRVFSRAGPEGVAVAIAPADPTGGQLEPTVPFVSYYDTLEAMDCDLAVLPMRPSRFNLAKSDVTLLSWAIKRVPVVAARTGPYAAAEAEGFPAVYVDHEDEDGWISAIRDLVYDAGARAELARRAQAWVLERRCVPAAGEVWERALEHAVELGKVRRAGAASPARVSP